MKFLRLSAVLAASLLAVSAPARASVPATAASAAKPAVADDLIEAANAALNKGDPAEARRLMEQAAATGDPEGLNGLSIYLIMGVGGPVDETRGKAMQEEAVAKGSRAALVNVGMRSLLTQDPAAQTRGVELLSRAYEDERTRAIAAVGLAEAYLFGWGVAQDVPRGVGLLDEAEAGDANNKSVLFLLGRTYQSGWGGRAQDPAKSYGYFRRAAELGDGRSQREVGLALLEGRGVRRNGPEAFDWFSKAAAQGEVNAYIDLGAMLALGEAGTREDDVESRKWYLKAIEKGSAYAMTSYAGMLMTGEGGEVDMAQGMAFLELAAEAGDARALQFSKTLDLPRDPATRARVDALKKAWVAAHGAPHGG